MSTVDEQHVRERLQDALENIEVPAPPGRAITGRGRRLRWQRRAGAVAGLAVLVALGVSLPRLGSAGTVTPVAAGPAGGQVVVDAPPAAPAVDGVIASGTTGGQRWKITLKRDNGISATAPGVTSLSVGYPSTDPVEFSAGLGAPHARLLMAVGMVRADVTAVTVQVAGAPSLRLIPVQSLGKRWVGMVVPATLHVTNMIAYGATGAVGHTVPYSPDPDVGFRTLAWLAPGQPGQARRSIRLPRLEAGPGVRAYLDGPTIFQIGPWGECVAQGFIGQPDPCNTSSDPLAIPRGGIFDTINCDGADLADVNAEDAPNPKVAYCLAGAAPRVSRIELRLSDGSVHELEPVAVGHIKYLSFALSQVSLTRWTAFDAAGHQLATGTAKSL
ncbi:MAG TPA: hypothetical protein VFX25_05010 [Streptosporangiaceae bacterium]|nr:hypothetical protein [Streptosporangiaceae bacterium]